uniref:Cytochrome P450 n=2 Tax=Tetranychus urticae TaxID=32264 RepID=T1KHY4_TETUR
MRKFDQYPSYSLSPSQCIFALKEIIKGPEYILKNYTSKTYIKYIHQFIKHQDYIVLWITFYPILFVLKSNCIEDSLKKHNVKTSFTQAFKPFLSDGLVLKNGERWKKFRKIGEMNLKTKMLSSFIPTMSKHGNTFITKLYSKTDSWVDLQKNLSLTTFNVISECAMGISTESDNLQNDAETLFSLAPDAPAYAIKRLFNPLLWPEFIYLGYCDYATSGKIKVCSTLFKHLVNKEISRQQIYYVNDIDHSDEEKEEIFLDKIRDNYLSHLVSLYIDGLNGNDDEIPIEDIEYEINNFIIAGFETVKVSVLWTLACIASEPEIQERIYREINDVLDDDGYDIEKLNQLTYLDCCVREGLRLFPPIFSTGRTSQTDGAFAGRLLPKSTEIITIIWAVHHDETIYPEPEKYDPDRFSSERVESIPSSAWIPFGFGPRTCIGYRFALCEAKLLISLIIKHFTIQTNKFYDQIDFTAVITLKPIEPMLFKFTPRGQILL